MQEKRTGKRKSQRGMGKRRQQILIIGSATAWLCIGLCVIQLMRVQAQLDEQREILQSITDPLQTVSGETAGEERETAGAAVSGKTGADGRRGNVSGKEPADIESVSYADLCGLEQVDKPQERSGRQVLARLEELGAEDWRIAEICNHFEAYPDRLLEALANNPEMTDFVMGYLEAEHRAAGGLTEREKAEDYPLFLQWDPRWGYVSYGDDSCIALSGCGPTCLSMVLFYLTGNESLTPDRLGTYSMENDYYLPGTGTLWSLFEETAPLYGVAVSQPEAGEREMKAALDRGCILVCSMGPGDFTVGGHFVVIYGYDKEGFLINDPNCVARSRQSWPYDRIDRQIKHLWVFERAVS